MRLKRNLIENIYQRSEKINGALAAHRPAGTREQALTMGPNKGI